ncbi:3-hydroxyacyl-CoA dehydrogenase NAD-binding domain-containing protein [Litchfieldella rifensis]|uniref:3-hydroxyacyl-CoA dehydrogenase NAD-binding domain-containing protein n=1 Tax=Litchfieldella rifensis TaxID=762643 RepID=A0ABV7LKF9_9GAMM
MPIANIAVIGAGTMGQGIAQLCAQQGYTTWLYDVQDGAAERARQRIAQALDRRVAKGRMTTGDADAALSRVSVADSLAELSEADLVVEAIVEDLAVKRALFAELETLCRADALLCTNTSSLSVGEIAAELHTPQRFAGLHFFNPPTAMKLVEVVSADATAQTTQRALHDFARSLGKTPVAVSDSPGFIVNRCARPFYSEALWLLEHGAAAAATIDACLKSGGGFPLGPFELIDLVGLDINLRATETVWQAFDHHPRFRPSPLVADKVAAGQLGRKSGVGFYRYDSDDHTGAADNTTPAGVTGPEALIADLQAEVPGQYQVTDGRTATELAAELGQPVAVLDTALCPWANDRPTTLAFATHGVDSADRERLVKAAAGRGVHLVEVADRPGLIVLRVAAMLINEARFALNEGIASADDMDTAMRLGLNFALGPWAMLARLGVERIRTTLERATEEDPSGRYTYSPSETQ